MPRFVVCVPVEGGPSIAPCEDADGSAFMPVVVQLPAPGQISFANSQTLFSYGFVGVLSIWLVGIAVGQILSLIRKA